MKSFITLLSLSFCIFLMTSCGDDAADCTAASFNSAINAKISAVNSAGQIWAQDPTQENCDNFMDAANDYLDAVEEFDGCAGLNQSDFDAALQAARDAVSQIPC